MKEGDEGSWQVYMVRDKDGRLYTGISIDVDRRIAQHESGKGAKALRGRGPLELVFEEACKDHSQALKREVEIKNLSKKQKELLLQ